MRYFEDFEPGQVVELGSRSLSEEEIINFAKEYDPQPFHVDPEKAKKSIYGGLIASGWQTGAIFMRLLVDRVLNNSESLGSPGLEEIRWLKPVRPGDTLSGRFIVLKTVSSKSRPTMGIVRSRSEIINQNGEVVGSLIGTNFFGRRP